MNHPATSRLVHLVDLMREKSISRIEMAELEELLQDENHLEEYVQLMAMDSMWTASFANEGADNLDHLFPHPANRHTHVPSYGRWFWGGIAAAITIGITGFWALKQASENQVTDRQPIVPNKNTNTPSHGAKPMISGHIGLDAGERDKYSVGTPLEDTRMVITKGLMEVETAHGDRLIIEAPASFSLIDHKQFHLDYGKITIRSYNKSHPITVSYGDGYRILANGMCALAISQDSPDAPEVCAIRGDALIRSRNPALKLRVAEHESIRHIPDGHVKTITFNGDEFFRQLPQQDLAWVSSYDQGETVDWINPNDPAYAKLLSFAGKDGQSLNQRYGLAKARTLSIDVSDLVWKPGNYRAILKWIQGTDAMIIEKIQLYHQGQLVSEDVHTAKTGLHYNTHNHIYQVTIPSKNFARNNWEIRATVKGAIRDDGRLPEESKGMLHFAHREDLAITPEDCIGDWEYHFDGDTFMRRIRPDGSITLFKNGKKLKGYTGHWHLKEDILRAYTQPGTPMELHMIRGKDTLIFLDRPYNSAKRIPPANPSDLQQRG